ncbi:MAG: hypothetical protein NVSMB24_07900 [Mucilaginibacter sp.]
MNAVIIFDVSDNNEAAVRNLMRTFGYYLNWSTGEGEEKKTINLPHNIVWKPNTESQQGLDDINRIIELLNSNRQGNPITLLRCVVLNSSPWKAIDGTPV